MTFLYLHIFKDLQFHVYIVLSNLTKEDYIVSLFLISSVLLG